MSERIRVAVVGIGNRGLWALKALRNSSERFEVTAMVDRIAARLVCARRTLELPATIADFTDISDCLAAADRGEVPVDAVVVTTPDGAHAEPVEAALAAGKWVFVEKPLEITAERLKRIVDADRAAGGKTFVGFNLRFAPVYRKIKQLIEAGEVGRILTLQADEFYGGSGRTYFRRWNRLRSVGGGLWITKCCHDFDLLYWLTGSPPTKIYAYCALGYYRPKPEASLYCRDCKLQSTCPDRHDLHPLPARMMDKPTESATGHRADLCLYNSDKDTFDHGQVMVQFANGATATYTVNVVSGVSNRRLRVSGTKATVDGDPGAGTVVIHRRDPESVEHLTPGGGEGHGGADKHLMQAFADFIGGKPSPLMARPAEATVAVQMGLAATRSCDEGRPIVPDVRESEHS